jgi:hypothetical protein
MTHSEGVLKYAAPHDGLIRAVDQIEANDGAEFIDEVSKRIRRYFHFQQQEHIGQQHGFSPRDIADTKRTSCFGFSVITSEILSYRGIANAILWANLHALVAALDTEGRAWLLHSDVSQLNSQATPEMATMINCDGGGSLSDWLNGSEQRAAMVLDTGEILRVKGRKLSHDQRRKLRWLSFIDDMRDPRSFSELRMRRGNTLMATLTRDSTGRQMLENMARFSLALLRHQNDDTTANLLLNMSGVWPEIDRRNLRDNSYLLNGYLRGQGTTGVDTFLDQVDVVADGATELSSDLGVSLWKPDLLRRVAIKTDDAGLMNLAIEGYEAICEKRHSKLVESKLKAAEGQLERLAKKD